MSFTKINKEDYVNKGVTGLPDQPALPTLEMQKKFDELSTDVIIPKFNELSAELDKEVKNLKEGTEGDLSAAVTGGTKITDITQITSGGMFKDEGGCNGSPTDGDGIWYAYFASVQGYSVSIIAVSLSDHTVYTSINSTSDGTTWINSGWTQIAKQADLDKLTDETEGHYITEGTILSNKLAVENGKTKIKLKFVIDTYYPEDVPDRVEGAVIYLCDYGGSRQKVLFVAFGSNKVYVRSIFGDAWNTEWESSALLNSVNNFTNNQIITKEVSADSNTFENAQIMLRSPNGSSGVSAISFHNVNRVASAIYLDNDGRYKTIDNFGNVSKFLFDTDNIVRDGGNYTDIFSTSLASTHACWNKWCSIHGSNLDNSPCANDAEWWEVFTEGYSTRAFQFAVGCYRHQERMYVRYKHDNTWSDWDRIITASCFNADGTIDVDAL